MDISSRKVGLFLGPILFIIFLSLPRPSIFSEEAWSVIAMAALMLTWWITEAVPLAVTALIPMVALPLLGVKDMKAAAAPYANPIVFLFMGGFMIALAMERWKLHRRIALNIVRITGTNANGIVLGFLLATATMSMWISNTATTVMMLPIALSVIDLLVKDQDQFNAKGIRNFSLSIMLCIAYGANVGGTATIIGTPPNVVFAGFIEETYDFDVGFLEWMMLGLPFCLIMLVATYWMVVGIMFPNRLGQFEGASAVIQQEIVKLGPISREEKRVLAVFLTTALLWIFRSPINNVQHWVNLTDPIIAMLAAISLFLIPLNFKEERFLLQWVDTQKLPWGILLLFGGGLSLAGALFDTGIIDLIGKQFEGANLSAFYIVLGLAMVSLFLTEVMSNVALVAIFLPVVSGIAAGLGIAPLEVCIPITLASSCAFMLPMSTPPNAIVFASGYLKVSDMVRVGVILNMITILVVATLIYQLIPLVFTG